MARDFDEHAEKVRKAHAVFIRLVLPPYTIHFKSSTFVRESTLALLDTKVCKETLKSTASNAAVRHAIGTDVKFWNDLIALFRAAIPSLERRSFTIWDPSAVDYESTSGALIASHYPGLWRDLERLNDLVSISRNCLTVGPAAQDLAAERAVDAEIYRLINCCVRVTARGYDGEAGTGEEEKWQWIVNAYKKLLITSLQFLNNLVAQNERRKLMLWVALFDHPSAVEALNGVGASVDAVPPEHANDAATRPEPPINDEDILIAYGKNYYEELDMTGALHLCPNAKTTPLMPQPVPPWITFLADQGRLEGNGYVYAAHRLRNRMCDIFDCQYGREPTRAELHLELARQWSGEIPERTRESWMRQYQELEKTYRADLAAWEAKQMMTRSLVQTSPGFNTESKDIENDLAALESELTERIKSDIITVDTLQPPSYGADGSVLWPTESTWAEGKKDYEHDEMRMMFSAEAGTKILESGKAELLKRLEGYAPPPAEHSTIPSSSGIGLAVRTARSDPAINPEQRIRSRSRSPLAGSISPSELQQRPISPVSHGYVSPRGEDDAEVGLDPLDQTDGIELDEDEDLEEGEDDGEEVEDAEDDEESEAEDQEDDEEDYPGSTEDGRGLLTDVPLILGPSEIEVLPMLIMSGIVPPPPGSPGNLEHLPVDENNAVTNMHTVRTHLLLSQSNGRNLLRELLIFVAAWDLREEELYFKFMVKIMEATLKNGLMPYAYHAFRDRSRSKDIISPAQAVIMKLLTCIFRGRGEPSKTSGRGKQQQTNGNSKGQDNADAKQQKPGSPPTPNKVDLHVLNFIFTEFRQHIIPQTCALIFLQGQIHAGRASPEDFPLNLWDMERMYEGVYQYLEFFAVLTEEGAWKGILGEWEMASELVTLLRELEGGVEKRSEVAVAGMGYGKGGPIGGGGQQHVRRVASHQAMMPQTQAQRSLSADAAIPGTQIPASAAMNGKNIVPVERPFDVAGSRAPGTEYKTADPATTLPPLPAHPLSSQPIFEPETPLAYPEDPVIAPLAPHHVSDGQHLPLPPIAAPPLHAADQDEPSDFEWRNLKKLTVLVLSSLVWKNKNVQDQVRKYGGLEALVSCCRHDEHNPYIREHAIMCLRFAVEGCEENAEVIRHMAGSHRAALAEAQQHSQKQLQLEGESVTLGSTPTTGMHGRRDGSYMSGHGEIPREVLDTSGYETFMDGKGNVGLRRKDGKIASFKLPPSEIVASATALPPAASSYTSSSSAATGAGVAKPASSRLSATKLTAEKAAELMQNALRDLPLGDKLITDRQKADALARLDQAFESTEKVLGRQAVAGAAAARAPAHGNARGSGPPAGA